MMVFESNHPPIRVWDDIPTFFGGEVVHNVERASIGFSPWELKEDQEVDKKRNPRNPPMSLDNFKLRMYKVDRFYFFAYLHEWRDSIDSLNDFLWRNAIGYEMYFRNWWQDTPVYVYLRVRAEGDKYVYVTKDPEVYLKSVVRKESRPDVVYGSMLRDGLDVDPPSEFDQLPAYIWRNVPPLKFLCCMAFHEVEGLFDRCSHAFPPILLAGVSRFRKIRQTFDHYRYFDS